MQLYRERLSLNSLGRQQRIELQNSVNAQYILRNYLAQSAIELSEKGDYSMIEELQKVLSSPFINQPGFDRYAATAPDWGKLLEISCSS
jgi:protein adenylyltransferase